MSSKRSHLRGRLPEIKTTDGEVIMDLSKLESSLEASVKNFISVIDEKTEDIKKATIAELIQTRASTFDHLPDDVRSAAIRVYVTALSNTEPPIDEESRDIQRKRFEMLASNIIAGFTQLLTKEPASEAVRQQAQVMINQAETISRERKAFDKSVSELPAPQ
ncbi:hypothetical protein EZQ75_004828 [Escherichia coli]|nr:hypothetical protein [Escherichia coli]EES4788714.1 hypothetical protein [Escherichia coli]EES4952046.1 hypothetical protein [Escherichia coli]MBB7245767.1 hypothetical protein [Escherichia coli]